MDASEENDGYSSGEDPMNSDPEDDVGRKLVSLNLFTVYDSPSFATSNRLSLVTFDPSGSREVHSGGRLREGGTSGAVCQEWRHGPADQRRRGGTVVNIFVDS